MSRSLSLLLSSCWSPNCGRTHLPRRRLTSSPHLPSLSAFPPLKFSTAQLLPNDPSRILVGFPLNASSDSEFKAEESSTSSDEVTAAKERSTLPDRFRNLTKEALDRPLRWPWLISLCFGVYTWRAVLWELSNWKSAAVAVFGAACYVSKLLLGLLYQVIGPPITGLLWCVDFLVNFIRGAYSGAVAAAPVAELLWIIALAAAVAAVAETASPGSVNSQQNLLTAGGVLGYMAVGGKVNGVLFWVLLAGSFFFARFVGKRDLVAAALPAAAVLISVGETWLRALTLAGFICLGVLHKSKAVGETESLAAPVPLQLVAVAIGIHVAAKWLRYRHLTWMIV